MTTVRGMLGRVRRLEEERVPELLAKWGGEQGLAAFEAECMSRVDAGFLDSKDVPDVLAGIRLWLLLDSGE